MRRRPQRFERLKFRELDGRARDALRVMLERLPVAPWTRPGPAESPRRATAPGDEDDRGTRPSEEDAQGGREGGPEWLLAEVQRLLAQQEPLESPLSFYAVERTGGDLVLLRTRALTVEHPEALPRREDQPLGRVRRAAPSLYRLLPPV